MRRKFEKDGGRHVFSGRDEDRAAMCDGKPALTWAQVRAVQERIRRKRAAVAYHCPACRAWHVGSPMKRAKRTTWKEW